MLSERIHVLKLLLYKVLSPDPETRCRIYFRQNYDINKVFLPSHEPGLFSLLPSWHSSHKHQAPCTVLIGIVSFLLGVELEGWLLGPISNNAGKLLHGEQ